MQIEPMMKWRMMILIKLNPLPKMKPALTNALTAPNILARTLMLPLLSTFPAFLLLLTSASLMSWDSKGNLLICYPANVLPFSFNRRK